MNINLLDEKNVRNLLKDFLAEGMRDVYKWKHDDAMNDYAEEDVVVFWEDRINRKNCF